MFHDSIGAALHTPLGSHLLLGSCPQCGRSNPTLKCEAFTLAANYDETSLALWATYICSSCGLATLAGAKVAHDPHILGLMKQGYKDIISHARQTGLIGIFPSPQIVSDDIPQSARTYLQQAVRSISTPDGAVLLAGSAVDAMLKAKNLVEGSLNYRINLACDKHLITSEMVEWAHSVRLEANGVRHADMKVLHHTRETAARAVEFANALGEFMFVLPARIQRGRSDAANPIK